MKRRPAAAAAPRRRPAAALEDPPERRRPREDIGVVFARGEVVKAESFPPALLEQGQWLVSEECSYFEQPCKWAGKVARVVLEGGEVEAQIELTGTQCESLLKFASGQTPPVIRAHFCKVSCDQKRTNPDLVHLKSFRKLEVAAEKTWETNLIVCVDEIEPIRRAQEAWQREREGAPGPQELSSPSPASHRKKKKKKKEEKKGGSNQKKKQKYGGKQLPKKA